jgi:hypothetical protein
MSPFHDETADSLPTRKRQYGEHHAPNQQHYCCANSGLQGTFFSGGSLFFSKFISTPAARQPCMYRCRRYIIPILSVRGSGIDDKETCLGARLVNLRHLRLAHLSASAIVLNSYNKYRAPTENRLRARMRRNLSHGVRAWYLEPASASTRTKRIRRWEYPLMGVLK